MGMTLNLKIYLSWKNYEIPCR